MAEEKATESGSSMREGDICDHYSNFDAEYSKIKQLGRAGQYGTTHLCSINGRDDSIPHSVDDPKRVAVKIVNKQRFKDSGPRIYAKWVELQKNEITTLLLTRHPNIVRLYRVMEDEQYVYLVMEYLPGGELLDYIVKTGKVSEYKVAHIVGQILSALDYMHQRDILHLDLKPENVMLADNTEEQPCVKLIDFGFAAVLPRLEGKMVGNRGTPYYMGPEVWKGNYDRSADVWAVGVMCFVMLFGFLPFYDDHSRGGKPNIKEIKRQIKKGFHENVTKRGCGPWFPRAIPVSSEAKNFISHLLRMDVRRRYTVEEALGDPWVRGNATTDTLPEIVMRGLAQFSGATQNNRALALLAADLTELNSTKLESTGSFSEKYATDGKIQKEEFVNRFGKMCNMRQHEMETIFDDLDDDHDGFITIETVNMVEAFHQLVAVDDRLVELFDSLDEDGDGLLNEVELQNAVNRVSPQVRQLLDVKALLEVTDTAQDGVIDRDEFIAAIHPARQEPNTVFSKEAKNASQYAISIRQKSALFFDLLNQCEQGLHPVDALNAQRSVRKQLTVNATFSRPTSIAEFIVEESDEDGEEPYDPRDHLSDVESMPLDELDEDPNASRLVEGVMADVQKSQDDMPRKDTGKKKDEAKELVQHFKPTNSGGSDQVSSESSSKSVQPDNGAGNEPRRCCFCF